MSEETMHGSGQYLTFTLGEEVFALDIGTVREVLEYTAITRIPRMPTFMKGVINLRGHAVPVMDMRLKFGMPETEHTVNTCIIIVEVAREGDRVVLGALADSVREVVDMDQTEIENAPSMGAAVDAQFLRGIGKLGDEFVLLLDIDKSFSLDEIAAIAEMEGDRQNAGADAA
jgi:purine-binding chemotaxis protein CheW